MNPSAFIPYCAIGGNMSMIGKQVENFTYPVCTHFEPTILYGQRCYRLNLDTVEYTVRQGQEGGVSFIMDYNEERNLRFSEDNIEKSNTLVGGAEVASDKSRKAMIYIETLKPFMGYGGGVYELNSLKYMRGTQDFYKYGEEELMCQRKESLSECLLSEFSNVIPSRCKCKPYDVFDIMDSQASNQLYIQ